MDHPQQYLQNHKSGWVKYKKTNMYMCSDVLSMADILYQCVPGQMYLMGFCIERTWKVKSEDRKLLLNSSMYRPLRPQIVLCFCPNCSDVFNHLWKRHSKFYTHGSVCQSRLVPHGLWKRAWNVLCGLKEFCQIWWCFKGCLSLGLKQIYCQTKMLT